MTGPYLTFGGRNRSVEPRVAGRQLVLLGAHYVHRHKTHDSK